MSLVMLLCSIRLCVVPELNFVPWVVTQSLVSEKRSDWLTPWRVTMFVPSRGTHYNVGNK